MVFCVEFCGLTRVMARVLSVPVSRVCVMCSSLVVPGFVVLSSFTVMFSGVLVVLCSFVVMTCVGHYILGEIVRPSASIFNFDVDSRRLRRSKSADM